MFRENRAFDRMTGSELIAGALWGLAAVGADPRGEGAWWAAWHGLQRDLARWSDNSQHETTETDQHYVHTAEPDTVAAAIAGVVGSERRGDN